MNIAVRLYKKAKLTGLDEGVQIGAAIAFGLMGMAEEIRRYSVWQKQRSMLNLPTPQYTGSE